MPFVLLSSLLLQGCGSSETKIIAEPELARPLGGETLVPRAVRAAHAGSSTTDLFEDRFPRDTFADRYSPVLAYAPEAVPQEAALPRPPARREPAVAARQPQRETAVARQPARETTVYVPQATREIVFASSVRDMAFAPHLSRESLSDRPVMIPSTSYKVAALTPTLPNLSVVKQANTRLIGFENSAFPYSGKSARGGSSRYSDNRVLVHVPAGFNARKPGVIVVFFHGHGATLERDVRDRQLLPKQITESGTNAVLVAPQLAYDAADSSAGKFWERDGFKRFMAEAAEQLARASGDPRSVDAFANMPVVIVAYSGGFETAASCLRVGGLGKRVTGVVLMDALYGHLDTFASWIAKNRHAFFVSAYTTHNKARDDNLAQMLKAKGVPVQEELNGPMKPGTATFLSMGGISHRDFVTRAWTRDPVKDVLVRMAQR